MTIGTCEDTLTIVEEIGGTLWIEKTETRMNGNVFRFWWLSIAQRASYPNRLIAESLNDWIELYDYRRPDQWPCSISIVDRKSGIQAAV